MNTETTAGSGPVDRQVERGRHLGFMYIARRPCGRVSASCWDDAEFKKSTAKLVAGYIKRGDAVERVDRYENDPQPEWICEGKCKCPEQTNTERSGAERPAGAPGSVAD
jgi:hypothetical protein